MPGFETAVDRSDWVSVCKLRVHRFGAVRRRYAVVFPRLASRNWFGLHNNSLNNGIRALVERVFRSPDQNGVLQTPPPCTANVTARLKGFTSALGRLIGVHRPITTAQFVDCYDGRRRDVYQRAVESLEARPLTSRDFGIKGAFVKAEKINFTAKPDPAPRVIQPRDPRYNVAVGLYLKRLEHTIYHAVAGVFGGPTVMKGYTAEGVAEQLRDMWDSFSCPVALGLDASRFDQHVRRELLEWEHSVYCSAYRGADARRLAWLLRGQLVNRGYLRADDGRVKYTVDGSRMSGDMNTALGNCLIMCALVHTLAKERGVRVRLANNGDDCVVIMEKRDIQRFSHQLAEWFLEFGLKMKVEPPVCVFERIEFCQAHPVWDGERWVMVRDPRTSLSKDAFCTNRDFGFGPGARKWLKSVGDCGLAMSGGIPVLQAYYEAYIRHGLAGMEQHSIVQETGMAYLARGLRREAREPTEEARVSFWLAFGISPTHQRALEEVLRGVSFKVPNSPCIGPHGALGDLTI